MLRASSHALAVPVPLAGGSTSLGEPLDAAQGACAVLDEQVDRFWLARVEADGHIVPWLEQHETLAGVRLMMSRRATPAEN